MITTTLMPTGASATPRPTMIATDDGGPPFPVLMLDIAPYEHVALNLSMLSVQQRINYLQQMARVCTELALQQRQVYEQVQRIAGA